MNHDTIRELGYSFSRQLPSGEWIGIWRLLFTAGLFRGIDECGYRTRYCYETPGEALAAMNVWDGVDDPPGNWLKEKPGDRMNPRWLAEAKTEMQIDQRK